VATDDGLSASERKAVNNARIVVELPRALGVQLEHASGATPNGLEDLARCLVACVYLVNDAMGSLVREVVAHGFETRLQIPCDEEARDRALADLECTNLIATNLYLSAARLLGETGAA
jgi:hypothetical protein